MNKSGAEYPELERFLAGAGLPVLARIPYSAELARICSQAVSYTHLLSTRILVAYLNDGTLPESNNIIQQPVICTIDNVDEYYSG